MPVFSLIPWKPSDHTCAVGAKSVSVLACIRVFNLGYPVYKYAINRNWCIRSTEPDSKCAFVLQLLYSCFYILRLISILDSVLHIASSFVSPCVEVLQLTCSASIWDLGLYVCRISLLVSLSYLRFQCHRPITAWGEFCEIMPGIAVFCCV